MSPRPLRSRNGKFAKLSPRQRKFMGMPIEHFRRRLPPHLRWMADIDYLDKLGPEEQAWLLTVLETEYRGKAEADDASPLTREEQRAAAARVRSQSGDRRPDLMNFAEGYRERRVSIDDMSEHEIHEAMKAREDDDVYRLPRARCSLAEYKRTRRRHR